MLKLKLKMKKILPKPKRLTGAAKSLVFAIVLLMSMSAMGQKTVTGTISDENGTPVPAVNVLQKGTTNGTVADFDGNYSIKLVAGSNTLIFFFHRFCNQRSTGWCC